MKKSKTNKTATRLMLKIVRTLLLNTVHTQTAILYDIEMRICHEIAKTNFFRCQRCQCAVLNVPCQNKKEKKRKENFLANRSCFCRVSSILFLTTSRQKLSAKINQKYKKTKKHERRKKNTHRKVIEHNTTAF